MRKLLVMLAVAGASGAWAEEPKRETLRHFEEHVRPLLATRCYKCHAAEKQRGQLRLDSRAALLAGGETGPAIVPGKAADSLLIAAVRHESFEMPPDGKLPDDQIDALARWIDAGAPWPDEAGPAAAAQRGTITDADRQWWAFRPVARVAPPAGDDPWIRNDVDRFVLPKLRAEGLTPAPEADRRALVRRLYFDLHGLPPTPQQIREFLDDSAPQAYERLVDKLLASPRYGERWARYWLDLVRYGESDGFKQDAYRPQTWRYRDYVIRAFNSDKPYDRFIQEQLAGDEIAPDDPEALTATGYLRLWIYEYNQRDVRTQWSNILHDVTDVTADAFLGLGVGCARCHDHKFDPILQKDYFRLFGFFSPLRPRDDVPLAPPDQAAEHRSRLAAWEAATADIRRELDEIARPHRERVMQAAVDKFPRDIRPMIRKPAAERSSLEQQLSELALRQVELEYDNLKLGDKLKGDAKARWEELQKQLATFDHLKPATLPAGYTVSDIGPFADPVTIPGDRRRQPVAPGFLSVLDPTDAAVVGQSQSTGRRTVLARWLADPENPLTTRVIANRLWQFHFGRGLAASASDFGHLGEAPTHPELLDWLARQLTDHGWSLKHLHRLMVTSATYRQATRHADSPDADRLAREKDPQNRWLSHFGVRRLEAEPIRDALLSISGELDLTEGGPGAAADRPRRSVYLKVLRNQRDPVLDAFDVADGFTSTAARNVTTTPTQSLLMINGEWVLARAKALAKRLEKQKFASRGALVEHVYELAYGRLPSAEERSLGEEFLGRGPTALVDFCHVVLNATELVYVD